MRIASNILALTTRRSLETTNKALGRAMKRLASGQRVSSAGDDSAGLAIGVGLESQRRGLMQAIRNLNDATGYLQTSDGVLATQAELVQRMKELAVQAANGTLADSNRAYLNSEVQQLLEEFNRLTSQSNFNGQLLIDGSFTTMTIQVGPNRNQSLSFTLPSMQARGVFAQRITVGTGTFQARSTVSMSTDPIGTQLVDLNDDGFLDILSGSLSGFVDIALGNGDGTFQTRTTLATGSTVWPVIAGDLNGDQKIDVITGDNGDNTLSLHFGNGDGTFQPRTTLTVGSLPRDIEIADLNNDGKVDLVSADRSSAQVSIMLGNGDGTFQTRSTLLNSGSAGVDLVDLDSDGALDLITADFGGVLSVCLGNGNGTFQTRVTYGAGGAPYGLSMADVNNDEKIDALTVDNTSNTVSIFFGNGNGTFQSRTTLATGLNPTDLKAVDLNNDGFSDVITADDNSQTVSVFLGNGDGTFRGRTTLGAGDPKRISVGDIDSDGAVDFIVSDSGGDNISIFKNIPASLTTAPAIFITTQESAATMLQVFEHALQTISAARGSIGAVQNRLEYATAVNSVLSENIAAARSGIIDIDLGLELAEFSRLQILQQAGIAVLGQANMNLRLVLELLS